MAILKLCLLWIRIEYHFELEILIILCGYHYSCFLFAMYHFHYPFLEGG